jgi:hypothetical protein
LTWFTIKAVLLNKKGSLATDKHGFTRKNEKIKNVSDKIIEQFPESSIFNFQS